MEDLKEIKDVQPEGITHEQFFEVVDLINDAILDCFEDDIDDVDIMLVFTSCNAYDFWSLKLGSQIVLNSEEVFLSEITAEKLDEMIRNRLNEILNIFSKIKL